ncbi:MAG: molybdopterin-dependent oxidoreductase [Planctomycetaceae bacterium]
MTVDRASRRDFLQRASAALVVLGSVESGADVTEQKSPKSQPEAFWQDRMTPPNDGKRYDWFVDTRRCFGCHACEVSCKAENDVRWATTSARPFIRMSARTRKIPGMCQLCSTICGVVGYVKDGRLLKIEGNPNDPNSRGHLCARGHAGLNHLYHPERLLYPLKRVGQRGEGKWKRISWDAALNEIAAKLKRIREAGQQADFAFHQGRQRSKDALKRFLDAYGTKTQLSHRSLCSGNRRAANLTYLWESDWDLNDVEHTKYIINFGSNAFEAHQGHVPLANRIQNARFKNAAKLVTFDVRLSNTAGGSDEWFAPFPGTDGAIALAMSHAILAAEKQDAEFLNTWTNVTVDELREHLKTNTPEWAEQISGVPAGDIRRIALEFADAAPTATTMCNRGSSAHLNGYYNDRAIHLLNAVVGSVGKKGGWCWSPWGGIDPQFTTPAMPAKARTWNVLEDPPEYPLANEELINYHVCSNSFYNETAHYADIVLPWTTYLERWDLDARASYNLRPYVGLRTPMVKPLGESRDVRDFFPELARRIGGGMEKVYDYGTTEDDMRDWAKNVPENPETGKSGLDGFRCTGHRLAGPVGRAVPRTCGLDSRIRSVDFRALQHRLLPRIDVGHRNVSDPGNRAGPHRPPHDDAAGGQQFRITTIVR